MAGTALNLLGRLKKFPSIITCNSTLIRAVLHHITRSSRTNFGLTVHGPALHENHLLQAYGLGMSK